MTTSNPVSTAAGAAKPRLSQTMLIVIVLVVAVGAVVAVVVAGVFLGPSLSVTSKNFAPYSTPVPQSGGSPSSMTVVDTNGGVTVSQWSQAYVMVNGTVTARGFGSSTDAITFVESNSSGNIVFEAVFPASQSQFFSASYTVDIHVFEPASYHFYTVQIITVNGDLHVSGISATSVSLTVTNGGITATGITAATLAATDTNGSISLTCASCSAATVLTTNGSITTNLQSVATGGSYLLQSTNGNVNLTLPVAASCTITANTTNGSVSSSGLGVQVTNHAAVTLGTGTATVNLKTTNGSIIVTGQ